jgi:hypothetical protein
MKATQRAGSGDAPWIEERGERYGNNRKMMADQKVNRKRALKAKIKAEDRRNHFSSEE